MLRILYATDGSEDALRGLEFLELLRLKKSDAVRVVSVVSQALAGAPVGIDLATGAWEVLADIQLREREMLVEAGQAAAERLEASGVTTSRELRHGDPATEILAAAAAWEADLIVLGSRGLTGLKRFLLGSVARNVAKHAHRPVLVARAPENQLRQVVLATDGSAHAAHALRFAGRLPLPVDSRCTVVNVVRPYAPFPGLFPTDRPEFNAAVREVNQQHQEAGAALTQDAAHQLSQTGKQARPVVREGDPAEQILELALAEEADLIILGARGASAIQGLLVGSVADRLLKSVPCSVLLVH